MIMRILLVDTSQYYPSSPMFLESLEELSKEKICHFEFFDIARFLRPVEHSTVHKILYRLLGRRPVTYWVLNHALLTLVRDFCPDVVIIVKGAYISPYTLNCIKKGTNAFLVNYATDDPFNPAVNTKALIKSIALYDLYVCTKKAIITDVQRYGCANVIFCPFGFKPSVHFPEKPVTAEEKARFSSDVTFIGGCDRDRIPFFETLVRALPSAKLHLYGGYWDRHATLRHYHHGFVLGRDYRLALGGTKIAINLVRRANRDGHVMRTFEISACGAFMLADRTEEHLDMFEEDKEAIFFSSVDEAIEKIQYYLEHDAERICVAQNGYNKVVNGKNTYTDRLCEIIKMVH
jgi:spore maturation protein CgeB